MADVPVIEVGVLGVGTVGAAVVRELAARRDHLIAATGAEYRVRRALVRQIHRDRGVDLPAGVLTTDPSAVLDDPGIDVIVEAMGGEEPAFGYLSRALAAGKRVVTANKEVMARRGPELQALANRSGARLRFEAAVGGGIPVMSSLRQLLPINRVTGVRAIVNGTTNYMLTEMARGGSGYAEALAGAQALGYAEPDPTADVEGIDVAFKLAILASLAGGQAVAASDIAREGITRLGADDIAYGAARGWRLKLIARAALADSGWTLGVAPTFVRADDALAGVDGATNAVELACDLAGPIRLVGAGAGPGPTASALIGDLLRTFREVGGGPAYPLVAGGAPAPLRAQFYLRLAGGDQSAVSAPEGAHADDATGVWHLPDMTLPDAQALAKLLVAASGASGATLIVEPPA